MYRHKTPLSDSIYHFIIFYPAFSRFFIVLRFSLFGSTLFKFPLLSSSFSAFSSFYLFPFFSFPPKMLFLPHSISSASVCPSLFPQSLLPPSHLLSSLLSQPSLPLLLFSLPPFPPSPFPLDFIFSQSLFLSPSAFFVSKFR